MASVRKLTTKEIYQINQERDIPNGFDQTKVILHNIRSMHNVGAVFRSADAFGIGEIILTGYTPIPPRPEISKTALGAEEQIPWSHFDDFGEACHLLKQKKYLILGVEQTDDSQSFINYDIDENRPLALVMGNEVTGIDDEAMPFIDQFVEIPQYGEKHSLNVSVTAGIIMFGLLEKFLRVL